MNTSLIALVIAALVTGALAFLLSRFQHVRRSYLQGVALWSRWLPVIATGVYLAVLAANLVGGSGRHGVLSLAKFFSALEVAVLFLVGPLFLTRLGQIIATGSVCYCIERLATGAGAGEPTVALYLLSASATFVAMLGDKLPWLTEQIPNPRAQPFREILLIGVSLAALAALASAVLQVPGFTRWLDQTLAVSIPNSLAALLLCLLLFGWLTVVLGFTGHFTIPLLSLPTILVVAYLTGWPSYLLTIPFVMGLALALTTADRRGDGRRRALLTTTKVFRR